MAGIKSTVEMLYDLKTNKSGIILMDIQSWAYEPINNRYIAKITDSVLITENVLVPIPESDPIMTEVETKIFIMQEEILFTTEQVDTRFSEINNPIETSESYTSELNTLISDALLDRIRENPTYRVASTGQISTADNWIIN